MTKKLGLVIDLDTCVGCHACAVNCKEWNAQGHPAPLSDFDTSGDEPWGVWLNRVHTYEAGESAPRFLPITRLPGLADPPSILR